MKPRSASTRPPMNTASDSEAESSFSEGVLSWGSSVNVNEDHNRAVKKEIEGIDATNDTLQANIKNEDRTSTQLAKDFSHARAEMVQLHRAAADEHDSATLKNQVRARLKAALRSELMSPASVVSMDSSAPELANEQDQVDNAVEKDKAASPSTAAFLEQRVVELHDLGVAFTKEKEALLDLKAEKVELQRQSRAIRGRIESDKLVEELEAARKDTASTMQDKVAEERRKRNTKEAVQKVRVQCGHHAQQIADQTKLLTSKKTKNEDQEAELALRLKHMEEQLRSDESSKAIESELASVSEQLDQLNQQLEAFDAIRAERAAIAAERAATKQETEQLRKSLDEFQPKLQGARSKQAAALVRLEEAKALRASVEAQCADNDKLHTDKVLPGQSEMNALVQEKEELAKSISKLHEEKETNEKENSKKLVSQSEKINKLELDVKLVKGELAEKQAKIESMNKARKELDEATQKELKEHRLFGIKFEEAAAAERERIEALQSERKRERKERCEEVREEYNKTRADLDTKLEICRAGADMLSTTIQLENQ